MPAATTALACCFSSANKTAAAPTVAVPGCVPTYEDTNVFRVSSNASVWELSFTSSQTETFAETLKTFVSSYVGTQPGTAIVGAAVVSSAAEKYHASAVVAAGKLQAILDRSKKVKFSK